MAISECQTMELSRQRNVTPKQKKSQEEKKEIKLKNYNAIYKCYIKNMYYRITKEITKSKRQTIHWSLCYAMMLGLKYVGEAKKRRGLLQVMEH